MSTYIIMVEELCRLVTTDPQYSELRVESTAWQERLRDTPKAIVAAAIGHSSCGKSVLLNKFLPSGPDFSTADTEGVALLSSPRPVALGDSQLFLLKLSGFGELNDDYLKMVYVTMRLADWVFVCLERTSFFSNLKTIMMIAKEANYRRETPIEKIFIMVESLSSLSTGTLATGMQEFQQHPLASCCQFLERGMSLTDPIFSKIHTTLLSQARSSFSHVPDLLLSLRTQFSCCVDYHDFQRDYSAPDRLFRDREQFRTVSPQKLFIKRHGEIELNDGAIEALTQSQLNPETPTVVLMVIGNPGLGKSTFLNHLCKELLRAKDAPQMFTTGNTTTHTTLESEFLPLPLHLDADLQVILIDLEGLDGTENLNPRLAETQRQLVAALLAVASVPCIIIKNERESLNFLEKQLKAIGSHQEQFGYLVEKVVLLFYDKDIDAGANEDIVRTVKQAQDEYKLQNTDIEILNKPSFVASHNKSRFFIQSFLSKCAYPKKDTAGRCLPIAAIVAQFNNVIDSVKQVTDIILTTEEEGIVTNTANQWARDVDTHIEALNGNDDKLCERAELATQEVLVRVDAAIGELRMGLKRVIRDEVERIVRGKLEWLGRIENVYRQIACLDAKTIQKDCSQLKVDLNLIQKMVQFYPLCSPKVQSFLPKAKSHIYPVVVVSTLVAGVFVVVYSKGQAGSLRDIWSGLKSQVSELGLTKLSGCVFAGTTAASLLKQTAALPAPYAGHSAIQGYNRAVGGLNGMTGVLTAMGVAVWMRKQRGATGYACTGLALVMSVFLRFYLTQWRKAEIREKAEIFHIPAALAQFYLHVKDGKLPVLLLLGVNSGSQQRFAHDFLSLCYPHSLLKTSLPLATGLNLLPFSYLTPSKQLANGLIVSLSLHQDSFLMPTQYKGSELAAKLISTVSVSVIFIDGDTLNTTIPLCFRDPLGGTAFVGYTKTASAARDCEQMLRDRGFQVELRNLQETKQFAREMYVEKVGNLQKVEKSGVQAAFRTILPF